MVTQFVYEATGEILTESLELLLPSKTILRRVSNWEIFEESFPYASKEPY